MNACSPKQAARWGLRAASGWQAPGLCSKASAAGRQADTNLLDSSVRRVVQQLVPTTRSYHSRGIELSQSHALPRLWRNIYSTQRRT
jgi:hypothetical protein